MHACLGLLENPSPCTGCLCLPCSALLKIAQVPRNILWTLWSITDQGETSPTMVEGSSTKYSALGHPSLVDRHFMQSTGHIYLQNPVLIAAEGKHGMAMHFKQMCAPTHSLSCLWLKGVWDSTLRSPIANFNAWWPKRPSMHFDVKSNANQTNKWTQPLS